ncbi:unnamed protein product [Musa hybrid cultivar]
MRLTSPPSLLSFVVSDVGWHTVNNTPSACVGGFHLSRLIRCCSKKETPDISLLLSTHLSLLRKRQRIHFEADGDDGSICRRQKRSNLAFVSRYSVVLVGIDCTLGETSKASEMEEILMQREVTAVDKAGNVVLDIEGLTQSSDKCSGSPKMTKALSRKGSCRMERRNSEEQDVDDTTKKVVVKVVPSHMELFKQPLIANKALVVSSTSTNTPVSDAGDGKPRKFIRVTIINPRRILLLFASLSSMGTMILIYFTLALHRRQSLD